MELTVSSEIYTETNFNPTLTEDGKLLSKFRFYFPPEKKNIKDSDDDYEVNRKKEGTIEIEHSQSTVLKLVGLQVWRGALLLADYIFHCRKNLAEKNILELGAGVGLTSIAASMYAKSVVCTDIDLGMILDLIHKNINRNSNLVKSHVKVMELDFKADKFSNDLEEAIEISDIVLAADVIYDDDLTDCFIKILDKLLNKDLYSRRKEIYIALEKRYVFTTSDLDSCPPCYDYFLQKIAKKPWKVENIALNFSQYFVYEKCKQLVLLKITNI